MNVGSVNCWRVGGVGLIGCRWGFALDVTGLDDGQVRCDEGLVFLALGPNVCMLFKIDEKF